jgi:nicotinamidase-related amidase
MSRQTLPVPPHFNPDKVGEVWRVPYQERAAEAEQWAKQHQIPPAARDRFKICLLLVDVQNTFCIPGFELFVGGRSGTGAVDDNRRLCEFIYRNLHFITEMCPTMDTHLAMQIFHAIFLINEKGEHPAPYSRISEEVVKQKQWEFNSVLSHTLHVDPDYGRRHIPHYVQKLKASGKYDFTVWPYHAMLGGIGHALVSAIEEAIFFHSIARLSQPDFQVKGNNAWTENYSVLRPEVLEDADGKPIAEKNIRLIEKLFKFDAVFIAGQAKSHCVPWTADDWLDEIMARDPKLAEKVYLLEDCTSPVVVPGVIDYTDQADAAFRRFADAGMHVVRSTDPIESWSGIKI